MKTVAVTDANDVLLRYRKVEKPDPQDIVVPDDCDLAPGRYRWDRVRGTFLPIAPPPEAEVVEPNALRAIARGFMAIRDGQSLPRETLDWLAFYERSLDNAGGR